MAIDMPTLFSLTPRCHACSDLGIELDAAGAPTRCWRIRAGAEHNEPNEAARLVERALQKLRVEKVSIDPHLVDVVKTLIGHATDKPCRRDTLIERHFTYTASSLRKFQAAIEDLRRVWLLPVASRKEPPAGYWIATDTDDFADYVRRAKSAPITQLTTVYRLAKRNFPLLAEQLELEFWGDLSPAVETPPLDAAAEAVAPL